MEKKTKISRGQISFYLLTAVLFTGTLLFFSFSNSEAETKGVSQKEIDETYLLVNERLLTPLNNYYGPYNYSNSTRRLMSRGGSNRLSQVYNFAFLLNHKPLCQPRRRNRMLCGKLEFNIFGSTHREPIPMMVDLENQTIQMEWENQQLTDEEWLKIWAVEVAKEKKARNDRTNLDEIRIVQPDQSEPIPVIKQAEKLSTPEEIKE